MKAMKTSLCVLMVLALTLCPVLASAEVAEVTPMEIHDENIPLAASNVWSFSNPTESSDAPAGESGGQPGANAEHQPQYDENGQPIDPAPQGDEAETEEIPAIEIEIEHDADAQPGDQTEYTDGADGEATGDAEGSEEDQEQTEDAPVQYNLDMAQFIPNKDYGLFGKNGKDLVNLNGKTLTLGKEYTLAAHFRIDKPVAANVEYTYWLPAVLTGNTGAAAQTFSYSAGTIATVSVTGNKLSVVFTDLAAEVTKIAGNAFTLTYGFKETLNATLVGDYTSYTVMIPTANGQTKIEFNIDGHPKAEETAEPTDAAPPVAPEEPESAGDENEETIPTIEEPGDANEGEGESNADVDPEPEPVVEPEQPVDDKEPIDDESSVEDDQSTIDKQVKLGFQLESMAVNGDPLTLMAELIGYEGIDVAVQWQYLDNGEWKNAPGKNNALVYETEVNNLTMNCDWRLHVDELASVEVTAEEPQQEGQSVTDLV